jgi:hypothetical protein
MLSEQSRLKNNYSEFAVYVDCAIKNEAAGFVVHCVENNAWRYDNISGLLKLCEKILNNADYPQPTHLFRKLEGKSGSEVKQRKGIESMAVNISDIKFNNEPTFLIKINYRQNASWQGTIKWLETNTEKNFRSALELIKLMDDAVGNESDIGWD